MVVQGDGEDFKEGFRTWHFGAERTAQLPFYPTERIRQGPKAISLSDLR